MKPSNLRHLASRPLPWLPPHKTRTLTRTLTPTKPSPSKILNTIKDPSSTLKQILTAFSSASRHPNFHHNYETYQTLIPLLSRRRQFSVAGAVLNVMRRRDGLAPGPTVLIPLVKSYCDDGRYVDAVDVFLKFSSSNRVFSFLFKTLVDYGELDVAEVLFRKAADLGFQIQVRYYNALIKGLCDHLMIDDGIRVFKGMLSSGVSPDVITFSTLISHLGKEGRVLASNAMFGKMLMMGVLPDLACYKILFRMYWRNQMVSEAVGILRGLVMDGLLDEGEVLGFDGVVGEEMLGAVLKGG